MDGSTVKACLKFYLLAMCVAVVMLVSCVPQSKAVDPMADPTINWTSAHEYEESQSMIAISDTHFAVAYNDYSNDRYGVKVYDLDLNLKATWASDSPRYPRYYPGYESMLKSGDNTFGFLMQYETDDPNTWVQYVEFEFTGSALDVTNTTMIEEIVPTGPYGSHGTTEAWYEMFQFPALGEAILVRHAVTGVLPYTNYMTAENKIYKVRTSNFSKTYLDSLYFTKTYTTQTNWTWIDTVTQYSHGEGDWGVFIAAQQNQTSTGTGITSNLEEFRYAKINDNDTITWGDTEDYANKWYWPYKGYNIKGKHWVTMWGPANIPLSSTTSDVNVGSMVVNDNNIVWSDVQYSDTTTNPVRMHDPAVGYDSIVDLGGVPTWIYPIADDGYVFNRIEVIQPNGETYIADFTEYADTEYWWGGWRYTTAILATGSTLLVYGRYGDVGAITFDIATEPPPLKMSYRDDDKRAGARRLAYDSENSGDIRLGRVAW